MTILGASYREVITQNPVSLTAEILPEGCAASWGDTAILHDWAVCKKSEVNEVVRLRGEVANPESSSVYTYTFQAYRFGFNPDNDPVQAEEDQSYAVPRYDYVPLSIVDFDVSDPAQVRTPPGTNFIIIVPNVLKPED